MTLADNSEYKLARQPNSHMITLTLRKLENKSSQALEHKLSKTLSSALSFVQGGLSILLCGGCLWEIGARAWSEGAVDWMCGSQDVLQLHVVLAAISKMFAR